jgi:hypothetical protein
MFTLVVAFALAALPSPTGLTLTGVVHDAGGQPLAGTTVFIRTAAPRQGVGVL